MGEDAVDRLGGIGELDVDREGDPLARGHLLQEGLEPVGGGRPLSDAAALPGGDLQSDRLAAPLVLDDGVVLAVDGLVGLPRIGLEVGGEEDGLVLRRRGEDEGGEQMFHTA